MHVAIGSTNPVKIAATKKAFNARLKEPCTFSEHKVPSQVPDQPFDDAIQTGARNRAIAAQKEANSDYGVGLEGGITTHQGQPFEYAWCAIVDRKGNVTYGHSFGVPVPQVLFDMITKDGLELGDAQDKLLNKKNTKHQEGFFGFATDNMVTREHGYIDMISAALAPIVLTEYYGKR